MDVVPRIRFKETFTVIAQQHFGSTQSARTLGNACQAGGKILRLANLRAACATWGFGLEEQLWNRQRELLEDVRIFRSLSDDERDNLADEMTPGGR